MVSLRLREFAYYSAKDRKGSDDQPVKSVHITYVLPPPPHPTPPHPLN